MGIEPFLVASSLLGVLASGWCGAVPACRRSHQPDRAELGLLATGTERADIACSPRAAAKRARHGLSGRTEFSKLLLIDDEAGA